MPDGPALVSMTGVGSARGATELGPATAIELRSVNGRGLSLRTRFDAAAAGLELEVERYLQTRFARGTITCIVALESGRALPTVDRAALAQVLADLRAAAGELGLAAAVPPLGALLAVPGVVRLPDDGIGPRLSRALPPQVAALLATAADGLAADRAREGEAMAAAMRILLEELRALHAAMLARAPQVVGEHRERVLARVNEFLDGRAPTLAAADVVRELALWADRVDVHEELARLDAHLLRAGELLDRGGEIGRPLEFLLQELLREVNTVGSKAQDVDMAHQVVEAKTRIDRLRELAANLA